MLWERLLRPVFERRRLLGWSLVLVAVAWVGREPFERLQARLPHPLNRNHYITVITDDPAPPVGAPLLQLSPRLEVLGVVEGEARGAAVPSAGDRAVRVSIFPQAVRRVLDDTEIVLRETSPDLLEVVSSWLTPERRAELAARAKRWHTRHRIAIDRSLDRMRELADEHLGADELGRALVSDPDLHQALLRAVETEMLDPVDWDQVRDRALDSEAGEALGAYLDEAGIASSAWDGIRQGYRDRWHAAWGPPEGEGRRAAPERRWPLPFDLLLPRWEDTRRGALHRAGHNLQEAFPEHQERIAAGLKELGRELAEEEEVEERSLRAAAAFAGDPELRRAIVERHGPEAWERVRGYADALGSDQRLRLLGRHVLESGLELVAGALRDLALDDAGEGLNPMLIAFIRARLLGKTQPVLIIAEPGAGAPARGGAVFVSRRR